MANTSEALRAALRKIAAEYADRAGVDYRDFTDIAAKADPARGRRIASAFDAMAHEPDEPLTRASYDAMARETMDQWDALKNGLNPRIKWIEPGQPDPYPLGPAQAMRDLDENNRLYVFPTAEGFGSDESSNALIGNPMLKDTGITVAGRPTVVNDIFRITHDVFGHAKEGRGFRASGEEGAWRAHSGMYTPLARPAVTTETRGQNSWLNFGPYGKANRNAKTEDTHFADQKIGTLPDWAWSEGADLPPIDAAQLRKALKLLGIPIALASSAAFVNKLRDAMGGGDTQAVA